MIDTGSLYGFIQIAQDSEWVQPTLAPNISQWMSQNQALLDKFSGGLSLPSSLSSSSPSSLAPHPKTNKVNLEFVWNPGEGVRKALNGEATNSDWTKKCMYVRPTPSFLSFTSLLCSNWVAPSFRTTLKSPIDQCGNQSSTQALRII